MLIIRTKMPTFSCTRNTEMRNRELGIKTFALVMALISALFASKYLGESFSESPPSYDVSFSKGGTLGSFSVVRDDGGTGADRSPDRESVVIMFLREGDDFDVANRGGSGGVLNKSNSSTSSSLLLSILLDESPLDTENFWILMGFELN